MPFCCFIQAGMYTSSQLAASITEMLCSTKSCAPLEVKFCQNSCIFVSVPAVFIAVVMLHFSLD